MAAPIRDFLTVSSPKKIGINNPFYSRIRAQLAALGTPIGPYDFQIAAIALAHHLILVTHNTAEFSRVDGLRIEDWEGSIPFL